MDSRRKRLLWLSLGVFILFSLLVIQFYKIQIIEGEKWSKLANGQHFFLVKEPFSRGTFYANSKVKEKHLQFEQKLAFDIEKFHLYVDPSSIPEKRKSELSRKLIEILKISEKEESNFASQFYKKSKSRRLMMWLDAESRSLVQQFWLPYAKKYKIPRNALYFVNDYQRSYPFGKLLGQVLHTVQVQKDEKTGQMVPTGGLELYFNNQLKGKQGLKRLMRSPRHAMETGDLIAKPENGADIYLTINPVLQAIVEDELEKSTKRFKAKNALALIMDPSNGEILALAQYPFFYPADYQTYFNDPERIQHTKVKAITDANEPGSVMKAVTVAIALMANDELTQRNEKPLFDPEEKMATGNGKFPGRSKPITDTHYHGFLNMDMAVQHSSNIYVSRLVEKIIQRLGPHWYRQKLQDVFGFGIKTGVELPSESPGFLPTPGKMYPSKVLEWSVPTPFSMAFGHNLLATPLQMVRTYALFANGGYLVKPKLVRKIVKDQVTIKEMPVIKEQRVSEKIVKRVIHAMKFTTKPHGTSRKGDIWGYTEVGKSSTAKKIVNGLYSERAYFSGFVGFTPVAEPAFVLGVFFDEPEYGYIPGLGKNHNGGTCGAIAFREISRRCLEYLGISPDDPHGYPVGDPRHNADLADWIPETRKLQEKYEKWNNMSEQHVKP